jgi:hypothetical protein
LKQYSFRTCSKVPLAEDDDVIQTLATHAAEKSLATEFMSEERPQFGDDTSEHETDLPQDQP